MVLRLCFGIIELFQKHAKGLNISDKQIQNPNAICQQFLHVLPNKLKAIAMPLHMPKAAKVIQ